MFFLFICILAASGRAFCTHYTQREENGENRRDFIKWVYFNVPYEALNKAMKLDIGSRDKDVKLDWIEMLAYLASKNGNNFKNYRDSQLTDLAEKLKSGKTIVELTKNMKHYAYYHEAFTAVLSGFLGEYEIEVPDGDGEGKHWERRYGLKAFFTDRKRLPLQPLRRFRHKPFIRLQPHPPWKRFDGLGRYPDYCGGGGTVEAMG